MIRRCAERNSEEREYSPFRRIEFILSYFLTGPEGSGPIMGSNLLLRRTFSSGSRDESSLWLGLFRGSLRKPHQDRQAVLRFAKKMDFLSTTDIRLKEMNHLLPEGDVANMRRLRLVVIVLGLVLALVVATVAIAGFVFGLKMTTGYPHTIHAIYPTVLSCSIQNGSCEITIRNQETYPAEAIGCLFQNIYAIQGNGQTVTDYRTVTNNQTLTMTTVNIGMGVLSTHPKGPPLTTTIAVNSSAIVYCTPSASVPTPTVGSQSDGEVQFTNQSIAVQFLGTWRK